MKNFTVFALLAAMAVPAFANDQVSVINSQLVKRIKQVTKGMRVDAQGERSALKVAEKGKKMTPGTTKTYGWWRNNWVADDTYTYTYDASGNVLVELCEDAEGDYSKTVNEYNENGNVANKLTTISSDGVNYSNYRKVELEYDPILTDVIIQRSDCMWMDGDWQPVSNNYRRIITRNEDGNITSVVIAVLFNGAYDPTQRLTITYGDNGQASTISEEVLAYNGREYYWEQGVKITDIVWETTDGQIYDPEDLFMGRNKIKTARFEDEDDTIVDVSVEYMEESDAFIATMTGEMEGYPITATSTYEPLENGGYLAEGVTYFMGEEMYRSREEVRYDDWGLMMLESESETEEGMTYSSGSIGEVEYDTEGKPAVYTVSEFYTDDETGVDEKEYVIRAEYSDYVDVTADARAVRPYQTEEKWYDLQGRPVTGKGSSGIVIKDGKAVMIR